MKTRITRARIAIAALLAALVLVVPAGTAHAASDVAPCIAQGIAATPPGLRDDFVHQFQASTQGPFGHFIGTLVSGEFPLCALLP